MVSKDQFIEEDNLKLRRLYILNVWSFFIKTLFSNSLTFIFKNKLV